MLGLRGRCGRRQGWVQRARPGPGSALGQGPRPGWPAARRDRAAPPIGRVGIAVGEWNAWRRSRRPRGAARAEAAGCTGFGAGERLFGDRSGNVCRRSVRAGRRRRCRTASDSGRAGEPGRRRELCRRGFGDARLGCLRLGRPALVVCDLAASSPGASNGGAKDAQNTNSDSVALKRFILVDRSGFAILPRLNSQDFPLGRGAATILGNYRPPF